MLANLRRSFALFYKEDLEEKDAQVKAILFALVHFHSLMLERKKVGPMGYIKYPFLGRRPPRLGTGALQLPRGRLSREDFL